MDPIHQFQIQNLVTFGNIGGYDLAFTNSALFMLIALGLVVLLTRIMKLCEVAGAFECIEMNRAESGTAGVERVT